MNKEIVNKTISDSAKREIKEQRVVAMFTDILGVPEDVMGYPEGFPSDKFESDSLTHSSDISKSHN